MINKIPGNIKAILFDMDGVLIDSMPHHVSSWQQVFSEYGIDLPSIVLRRSEGEKAKITMKRLAHEHGLDWSDAQIDTLVEKKRKIYRERAPRGLRQVAREAVDFARQNGLKTGIVTGSVKPNLEWTLSLAERSLFDVILSSEFYSQSKPHPDPYLKAAEQLGMNTSDCLVIENAPLGIRSAKAAGMICIAITTTLPASDLSQADMVISDLDQLKDLLIGVDITKNSGGESRAN